MSRQSRRLLVAFVGLTAALAGQGVTHALFADQSSVTVKAGAATWSEPQPDCANCGGSSGTP